MTSVNRKKAQDKKKQEEDIWLKYNRELCLYIEFMRAAFNTNIYPVNAAGHNSSLNKPATDILDTHGNFLETQITEVRAYGSKNELLEPIKDKPAQFAETPKRVVAVLEYIEMEYKPGEPEKIEARGFEFDYNDPKQMPLAIRERASAIFSMVYAAKAQGWEAIDFDQTSDVVERYILKKACLMVGMETDEEAYKPVDDNLTLDVPPIESALFQGKKDDDGNPIIFTKINEEAQEWMQIQIITQVNNFLADKTAPIIDGGPRPSESPSMKGQYQYSEKPKGKRATGAQAAFG
jgi:hypothetical protein